MTDVTRRPGDVPPPREGYDIPAPAPETGTEPRGATGTTDTTPAPAPAPVAPAVSAETGTGDRTADVPLLPHDDTDTFEARLRHAVAGFVDAPNDSVQEADHVLEELAARFTDAVAERRRTLRGSWRTDGAEAADTEQLRLALRDYRELAERLLHV
ncbi:hypothetical protein SHKM778_74820 [Streptomyces sp. KM77-8]|uniref:Uncharacterized protein n=1 Tax=Streptomyces haneummycinicus TaxID=3074435 RepID=A0AAT9HU33_9ACTN